jgi:hypothetical protein
MKNIAYFFWTGAINDMFLNCIASYRKLNYFDEWYILTDNNSILNYYPDFNILWVPEDWIEKRFYLKLTSVQRIKANPGDRIMILDGDTLCLKPIDNFFTEKDDIFLTTRHYNSDFKINAGVWGLIKSQKTDNFLKHASETILNPFNWAPYYQLKLNHPWTNARSLTNIDWPVDQDYLEIIYQHRDNLNKHIGIDLSVKVYEGGIYNCIVPNLEDDIIKKINPYIIHYKNQSGEKWRKETKKII